jgi:hypothetical protein
MEIGDQFAEQQFLATNVAEGQERPLFSAGQMSALTPLATGLPHFGPKRS